MRWTLVGGLIGSLLLTVSGWLYARIPGASWPAHLSGVHWLRAQPWHLPVGMAVAAAGLVLLTWAWWRLVRRARYAGLPTVRACVAAWMIPLLAAPPLFSGDGWSYVATGYLAGHDLSPYTIGPAILAPPLRSGVNARWLFTATPYGPVPLAWGGLASHLTASPWLLLLAYRVLALLGLALMAWAVPRLAARSGLDRARVSALVLGSPIVVVEGVAGLHNDVLVAALMLAALAVTHRDTWVAGALLAGTAAAVKVPGGLAAVGVVLLSLDARATLPARVRRTAEVATVTVVGLWGWGVVTGLGDGWVHVLSSNAIGQTRLALTTDLGTLLRDGLHELGIRSLTGLARPVSVMHVAGLAVLVVLLTWALLRRRLADDDAATLTVVAALLLTGTALAPVLHYWYLLWCLPLLGCVRLRRPEHAAVVAALATLGIVAIADPARHIHWLSMAGLLAVPLLPLAAWTWSRTRHHPRQAPVRVSSGADSEDRRMLR